MNKKSIFFLLISITFISFILIFVKFEQNDKLKTLEITKNNIESELSVTIKEQEELEKYKEYIKSDEYIEDIARKKLGLAYPDEIIFEPSN